MLLVVQTRRFVLSLPVESSLTLTSFILEHLEVNCNPAKSGSFIDSFINRGCHSFFPRSHPQAPESDFVDVVRSGQPSNSNNSTSV